MITIIDGMLHITCETDGAGIGYKYIQTYNPTWHLDDPSDVNTWAVGHGFEGYMENHIQNHLKFLWKSRE